MNRAIRSPDRGTVIYAGLTPAEAKELGRTLRFLRHGRGLTQHDVHKRVGVSMSYVGNLEAGVRPNATEDAYLKLANGYGIPPETMADFILRARILSALERRGLTCDQRSFVWRGIEQRMAEIGVEPKTDLREILAEMLERKG